MPESTDNRPVTTGDQPALVRFTSYGDHVAGARAPGPRWSTPDAQPSTAPRRGVRPARRLRAIEAALQRWLEAHSVTVLRVSLGAVFLGFGFLKFFPGVSPAERLVMQTTSVMTFGLVPGSVAIVAIATLECVIGLWLLSGRALGGVLVLLGLELVGILSPVVLLAGRLFMGPHHAPTLEGQYVLKDVILVGAVLVIAATVLRGRRRSRTAPASTSGSTIRRRHRSATSEDSRP
jgi:putative oxidoreductase